MSRFLIKCEGLRGEKEPPVREQFELAFREFGVPRRIRSNNGAGGVSLWGSAYQSRPVCVSKHPVCDHKM